MASMNMGAIAVPTDLPRTAIFVVLDVIPDYVAKTFGFNEDNTAIGSFLASAPIIREGGTIPDRLSQALIIYNASIFHYQEYKHLEKQIRIINPGVVIVGIPVAG